jgi:hypothetical protein
LELNRFNFGTVFGLMNNFSSKNEPVEAIYPFVTVPFLNTILYIARVLVFDKSVPRLFSQKREYLKNTRWKNMTTSTNGRI